MLKLSREQMKAACKKLIEGKQAAEQPRNLRGKLLALEIAGLIEYGGDAGWKLTEAGKEMV